MLAAIYSIGDLVTMCIEVYSDRLILVLIHDEEVAEVVIACCCERRKVS
jgi:hypothetical protein